MFEIAFIWRKLRDRRYGRLIASSLIGGCIGVTVHHVYGVPASRTLAAYAWSFLVCMIPGLAAGLIATILDFSAILQGHCAGHPRWLIRQLPHIVFVGLAVCGFAVLIAACMVVAWWSFAVFGWSPLTRS